MNSRKKIFILIFLSSFISCKEKNHNDTVKRASLINLLQGTWEREDDENEIWKFENYKLYNQENNKWNTFTISNSCQNDWDKHKELHIEDDKYISFIDEDECWYVDTITDKKLTITRIADPGKYILLNKIDPEANLVKNNDNSLMTEKDLKILLIGSGYSKAKLILGNFDDKEACSSSYNFSILYKNRFKDLDDSIKHIVLILYMSKGPSSSQDDITVSEVYIVSEGDKIYCGTTPLKIIDGKLK